MKKTTKTEKKALKKTVNFTVQTQDGNGFTAYLLDAITTLNQDKKRQVSTLELAEFLTLKGVICDAVKIRHALQRVRKTGKGYDTETMRRESGKNGVTLADGSILLWTCSNVKSISYIRNTE